MKKLKGKFYRYNGAPAAGTILSFELSQAATVIATREELEARGNTPHTQNRGVIHIELDENGCVPASAEIYANDELHPLTAYYVGGKWSEGPYEMPQNITAVRPEQPQEHAMARLPLALRQRLPMRQHGTQVPGCVP